ncbi:hypothetical protein [Loigolactobacillus backii]|uniref:Uncharacterized protein n=1 Tax=Loigolactobacillus backii TaxID=375175 RepID=A0A192GZH5_9LACO|nr:hypothetical protein [Loigolactobacillus backii]ANK58936.1 hypothetical protein AYR52_00830 [Loigolactobacillus backii]ANK61392.1 hypothetical protein AYR53_00645 [Loigolactobacillus backii]ANK63924.1 hypothetical protein AYR54_00815 [Loigolactobacillus backii]ANK66372.1 hypothetical protein AYR55_00820 [Loigolactobacillus backii]ANK69408.1 hypothetical protein AYR56_04070 [Loigolactobacillus backii]
MYDLIPMNMAEVAEKLQWYQGAGESKSESSVIQDSILAISQFHLDEALEGPYWTAKWQVANYEIVILSADEVIGIIKTPSDTFEANFRENANKLIDYLRQQVAELVKNH